MKKKLFVRYSFFPICLFLTTGLFAQTAPAIQWQKCLGGSGDDEAYSIQQTSDGGYIVAGHSSSNNGDISGHHDRGYVVDRNGISHYIIGYDYWVVKLKSTGTIEWQKCLGGKGGDDAYSIQQTTDGGYIVAGGSSSNDGDISGNHGLSDCWLVKLNSAGTIEWEKSLGGIREEEAQSIQQTTDGGYIVAGYSSSNDGDVSGNHAGIDNSDCWVVKLSSTGDIQWQKCLGGSGGDGASSIQQTTDGGYIVAGSTTSIDGDVTGYHPISNGLNAFYDAWVVKLSSSGTIEWQKCLGGSDVDLANCIQQTTDGGYIVAGISGSTDGDVSGNHGGFDIWIVKLNGSGNIQWQKSLGGSDYDEAASIQQTTDGGYMIAGRTSSTDGDVSGYHPPPPFENFFDYWAVKLDGSGNIQWQKCLGGSDGESAFSVQQTTDHGYIVAGSSYSNDGDVSGNHSTASAGDYWIIKLGADVALPLRLLSFTGTLENNTAKLNWQTTNEINTKDFIVERSADAISFSAIGKVNAETSSAITHSYHYTDNAPLPGTNYYRLRMEDNDGGFTYSNVVRVNHNNGNEINIAPNPVSNHTTISIKLLQKQKTLISIYDMAGRLIKILANAELQAGTHEFSWNTKDEKGSAVSAGIYFLKMQSSNYSETKKLVVVK